MSARGGLPHPDHEPSPDQLAAVKQLLASGAPPYVDFSLYGPYGRRMLKRLMFTAFSYNVQTGTWTRQELPGPPDFQSWWRSWMVLKTTFLILGEVSPEPLDLYGEWIRSLHYQYGPQCWWLIYQADVRMRSEEFERLRRVLQLGADVGARMPPSMGIQFDPEKPWDAVFACSVHLSMVESQAFWMREVKDKAFLYLARQGPGPSGQPLLRRRRA